MTLTPKIIAAEVRQAGAAADSRDDEPEEKEARAMVIEVTPPSNKPVVEVKQPEPVAKLKQDGWDEDNRMVCPCCTTYVFSLNLGRDDRSRPRALPDVWNRAGIANPVYEALVTHLESLEEVSDSATPGDEAQIADDR